MNSSNVSMNFSESVTHNEREFIRSLCDADRMNQIVNESKTDTIRGFLCETLVNIANEFTPFDLMEMYETEVAPYGL